MDPIGISVDHITKKNACSKAWNYKIRHALPKASMWPQGVVWEIHFLALMSSLRAFDCACALKYEFQLFRSFLVLALLGKQFFDFGSSALLSSLCAFDCACAQI